MDEMSWRAQLAKANINLLNIDGDLIYVEFTYHPKPGVFKWCKTVLLEEWHSDVELAERIMADVLSLRKELEG